MINISHPATNQNCDDGDKTHPSGATIRYDILLLLLLLLL